MKNRLIVTENVTRLTVAFEGLCLRDPGVTGMGLIYGFTGSGKTTSLTMLKNRYNACYVRAQSVWTPAAMTRAICRELGLLPQQGAAKNVEVICEFLKQTGRALLIDEADYLLKDLRMVELTRDLHDETTVPVLLVGMSGHDDMGIERQIRSRPKFKQLARRMREWVEFAPINFADAQLFAATNCEVVVEDDLIAEALHQCHGSIGLLTVALSRIEAAAKAMGLTRIGLEAWGDRALHLGVHGGVV